MGGIKLTRVWLALGLVAALTVGLGGCKALKFSKSSKGEQAVARSGAPKTGSKVAGYGPGGLKQSYSLCTGCVLITDRGAAVQADPKEVKGMLESITVFGDKVQFKGWAADVGTSQPVKAVLIFADGKLAHMGSAIEERYDVAQALGDGGVLRSGFSVVLPKALFVKKEGKGDAAIRVFALTQSGKAAELPFKKSP